MSPVYKSNVILNYLPVLRGAGWPGRGIGSTRTPALEREAITLPGTGWPNTGFWLSMRLLSMMMTILCTLQKHNTGD